MLFSFFKTNLHLEDKNLGYKFKRVLLKLSGEALAGDKGFGIDFDICRRIAKEIRQLKDNGVEIGIVVGGGNIWRGRAGKGMDRTTADHMGMLATCINSLALQDSLEEFEIVTRVLSALEIRQIAEPYIRRKAVRHLEKGRVVIFSAGTGNPFFSTDTAAALRAAEIEAEVILLAKKVDGVYDKDPMENDDAKKYERLNYIDILNKNLKVMDSTASSLCMDNNIPIIVFNLDVEGNILKAINGENIGTLVSK